jgi:ParB family transcriptional regulator, chromosome partitioning protein
MAKNPSSLAAAALVPVSLPLAALRPSPRNVRASPGEGIDSLAQSIARVGLLQSLVVVPAGDGKHYEVAAGARRLAALEKLAATKQIRRTYAVPCLVVPEALATTASLLENVERQEMHPADQLEAFKRLADDGRSLEDIAADFGVTPLVVKRRLKLAVLSPRLLQAYREGEASLEQLTVLALSDDHATQDTAFFEAAGWERDAQSLRRRVVGAGVHAGNDRLARFVGIEAYTAAGGLIRRDLFADETDPGYIEDVGLLEQLARDKMASAAQAAEAQGFAWVDVRPRMLRHQIRHEYRSARRVHREPDAKTQQRLQAIQARIAEISELFDRADDSGDELSEARSRELAEESEQLGAEEGRIEEGLEEIHPDHQPFAGALILIDENGEVVVDAGWLRLDESAQWDRHDQADGGGHTPPKITMGESEGRSSLSSSLTERLTTHQTMALQAELCQAPQIALAALVHKLALDVLAEDRYLRKSCLKIEARPVRPAPRLADEVAASTAGPVLEAARAQWHQTLPEDSALWFESLRQWSMDQLLALLAFLVAVTVDVVRLQDEAAADQALLTACSVDLRKWWTPTASAFFDHVPKPQSLAVAQALAPESVQRLSKLKKAALSAEVAVLAQSARWLPMVLEAQRDRV